MALNLLWPANVYIVVSYELWFSSRSRWYNTLGLMRQLGARSRRAMANEPAPSSGPHKSVRGTTLGRLEMPKPQVTSGVNCRLAKRVWGEPSRIAIQTLLRLTEAYGVSVAKGDPRAAAPADPSRYTAGGEGEGSGVSQSRAAGRAEVRLCNPVAQNARTPEGGVQARGGATSDRQGDRAVGNAVFQVLQEPTGRHRAGAGDCFVDSRWSKGAGLLSGDDLRGFSGRREPERLRQLGLPSPGTQSELLAAAELRAPGVLAADSEGLMNPPIRRQPRLRLDQTRIPIGDYVSGLFSAMVGDANDVGVRQICRFIIRSRAACWEGMWKKISSPFAVPAISRSISVPRQLRGQSEEWNERHDAHRACFPPDHGAPVPGRVPLVDMLEARMSDRRSRPLGA